ncbi:MAG: flippase-like domain-containing protein, partial [Bacillota bacterium]|nr:flippase-like domain-containing protein [Bacillota bacterium]
CAEAGRFRETVAHINRRRLPLVLLPFFLTVLYWGLYYSIAPVILAGFGVRAPFGTAVMWQILIILVLPYIPVPGGSGAVEFGLATLFSSFVPASVLGVFIVAWRFFTYYLTLICGAVLAFRFKK